MVRYYRDPLDPDRVVRIKDQRVSDAAYPEMVRKTVILCTDVVLTLEGDRALYLAKRCVYPMKGVWVLGGREWFNDETLHESIARCLKLETKQDIDQARFKLLPTTHFYSWVKTKQGDFPGKNCAFTFSLELSLSEMRDLAGNLSPAEYEPGFGIQRFTRERLTDEKCHPMLVDIYDEIYQPKS